MKVTVVGAGTMGSQIALQTALSGHQVALVDASQAQLERATANNQRLVARAVGRGRLGAEAGERALAAISATTELAQGTAEAELVVEAVFEDLEAKQAVFRELDRLAPEPCILASNSSTIAISRLAAATGRPERCCNLHFFHPVTVMELCEVVRGPQTSEATVAMAMEFVRSIGRVPVLLNREIHGFVVNRILLGALQEALELVEGGFASVSDIDLAVKKGLNWPMGPFELLDFSGIDVIHAAMSDRHRLGEGPEPSAMLRAKVEAGELGRKTGRGFYDHPARD